MLIEFKFQNFRSFLDKQLFSMAVMENKADSGDNSVYNKTNKLHIFKSAIVYGSNASGKSNLMKAFQVYRELILTSANNSPDDVLKKYDPFNFNISSKNAPVQFEADFLIEDVKYSYSFSFTNDKFNAESLYFYPQKRKALLFNRKEQTFEFGDYLKGQKSIVADLTNENQLFLSKGAQNNIGQLKALFSFINHDLMAIPFLNSWRDSYYLDRIAKELLKEEDQIFIQNFKLLLKSFDTGIVDFNIKESDNPFQKYDIYALHENFDISNKNIGFSAIPFEEESTGTQKLFVLGGLILRAIMNGRTILIDEFERSLHPVISQFIIQLFNDPKINSKNAQLILATHDTNLLSKESNLSRGQIWIVEKDKEGRSELFSLSDIEGVRKDIPFEKWYLTGRFGGVPSIESLNFKLNFHHSTVELNN